ncbi:mRNA capping enzyme-domain-containing protein [Apodospora peruviana]|uniref:mRNA cap guanine-N(7) methyltransferase n=1 Tax=Apodospora peruviana TaxID=516989 RepID=A0AAE0I0B5_9PEZI|nr:mRNA capping enzyme-domain-containing protein [Apodospora peruviana]
MAGDSSYNSGFDQGKSPSPAKERQPSSSPPSKNNGSHPNDNDDLPQPFDAKKLAPAKKRQRSTSPGSEAPRKPKRPGQRARISEAEREQIRQRALERERALAAVEAAGAGPSTTAFVAPAMGDPRRGPINDVVRAHYNAVPERGRDWRKTDSRIKGLRSFNNWVKSCIIQKFSPDEDHTPGALERGITSGNQLLVLDLGCGKGGDLGKWQQAPQPVELYVGLDPADVSIEQARDRYRNMANRGGGGRGGGRGSYNRRPPPRLFDARFQAKDCFGESLSDVEIVRQVGFSTGHVPGGGSNRGFDVVSMMFCMHYAFETEEKARQMLQNVAGALKKGGRLIGCIPSSDVIANKVVEFNKRLEEKRQQQKQQQSKAESAGESTTPPTATIEPTETKEAAEDGEVEEEVEEGEAEETAEWGNDIYRVRFPGKTPADGIFRPPFGWKYNFFLHEAVEEVPEYVVPWEAFRALAEDYNLELQYHKSFRDVWESEKDDRELGPLSERMGVRERHGGALLVSEEEMEAASFYVAFCFYKV